MRLVYAMAVAVSFVYIVRGLIHRRRRSRLRRENEAMRLEIVRWHDEGGQ